MFLTLVSQLVAKEFRYFTLEMGRKKKPSRKRGDCISERRKMAECKEDCQMEDNLHCKDYAVSMDMLSLTEQSLMNCREDIRVENFSVSVKGKVLLDSASLVLVSGRKYGLVGHNGTGKTTLLRHIANRTLNVPARLDLLFCQQEVEGSQDSAVEILLKADTKRLELERKRDMLEACLEKEDGDVDMNILSSIYEELHAMEAEKAEANARRILAGLGFSRDLQDRPSCTLSGGWRMRASLARVLYLRPAVLLLDEPTNHLDLNAALWLDNFLRGWKTTLLLVSHNYTLLENVCTDIIHLENTKLTYYRGNYTLFKNMMEQKRHGQMMAWRGQRHKLQKMKASGMSSQKAEAKLLLAQYNQQKDRFTVADDTDSPCVFQTFKKPKEYVVEFALPQPLELDPPILEAKEVCFAYEDGRTVFTGCNLAVNMKTKIAILGPNGVGKTTLLKLLKGDLQPSDGEVERNRQLRIGWFDQHSGEQLPSSLCAVEYLMANFKVHYEAACALLVSYGLPRHTHEEPLCLLSGGQRARVALAQLAVASPDVLLMDEPTNNLDVESVEAVARALKDFRGGVVLVSHNERLISTVGCKLYQVESGCLHATRGTLEQYRLGVLRALGERVLSPSISAFQATQGL